MPVLVVRHPASAREHLGVARDDLVAEAPEAPEAGPEGGPGAGFRCLEGPFRRYRRTLRPAEDGSDDLVETIDYALAVPYLAWLYAWPVRHALTHRPDSDPAWRPGSQPWWAPPQRLDERSSTVLALLAVAAVSVGYLTTLLTQTIAFAADEFGSSDGDQARALIVVRIGIVSAFVLAAVADRQGRRRVIVVVTAVAPFIAALGALAPSMGWLTATQTLGRPLALGLDMVIAVVATEEMPKGSRAYALGLLALATGFGVGLCVAALPLADLGLRAWRITYLIPLLFLVAVRPLARQLPESRRFTGPHDTTARLGGHWGRFWLLAGSGFVMNILIAPASGLQNEYLEHVRGYSATKVALFTLITQTPAMFGVLAGGELADRFGRRAVGALALTVGTVTTAATFAVGGWALWTWSLVGAVIGGAAVPALVVYQTELFPTAVRSRAKAGIVASTLVGSMVGLGITAVARDHDVGYSTIMWRLSIGPVLVGLVIWLLYPETAKRELEELNPEDLDPGDVDRRG